MSKSMLKLGAALAVLLALAACAADSKPSAGTSGKQIPSASSSTTDSSSASAAASNGPSLLTVTATDPAPGTSTYDTGGVLSLPAGPVMVTFLNSGTATHDVALVRVNDGSFSAYSLAAIDASPTLASLGTQVGSAPPTSPNTSSAFVANLTAGTYALLSFSAAPDGKSYAQHGMLRELTVVAR